MRNSGYDQIERHSVRQLPCTQDVQGHESPGKVGVADLRRLERHDNWVQLVSGGIFLLKKT